MDSAKLQEIIERQYLIRLLELTKSASISREQSRLSSQVILGIQPFADPDDALMKMEFFVSKFPEFQNVLDHIKVIINEENNNNVINEMHKHLREENVDAALDIAQNKTL